MKFSKAFLFSSFLLSTSAMAAPTDYPEYHPELTSHLPSQSSPLPSQNPSLSPSSCITCQPYPNEFAALDNIPNVSSEEKIATLSGYIRYLLKDTMFNSHNNTIFRYNVIDSLDGIEETLNNLNSQVANHEQKIKENEQNIDNLSLYTTDELANRLPNTNMEKVNIKSTVSPERLYKKLNIEHVEITQQLDKQIQQLKSELYSLNKKFKAGLAAQAALSGLFPPDNQNTKNITASVGGYDNAIALAVGVGYRFNDHVATRAGIAMGTKSKVTYNTAINIAW
ncbi:YadA-like family protein [Bisgaard Taxon 45]